MAVLYTLADLAEKAQGTTAEGRSTPIKGFLSVIIQGINLTRAQQAGSLYVADCPRTGCKTRVRGNQPRTQCQQCLLPVDLRLNPEIVGQVFDETASMTAGSLLFSDDAWEDLLGVPPATVGGVTAAHLDRIEQAVRWMRLALAFVWSPTPGKILVERISS